MTETEKNITYFEIAVILTCHRAYKVQCFRSLNLSILSLQSLNFIVTPQVVGMMNLCFPAVRIVHELFGDRLSPKTRFYPGLYTFFSVWGVVLGVITIVLFLWELIVYDNKEVSVCRD